MGLTHNKALVVTVSDGVSRGTRVDTSGAEIADRLVLAGYEVSRKVVPDEVDQISRALTAGSDHDVIFTTGGTGFGPRDVTPEATASVLEREAPGLAHLMMSKGLESTPYAALSRAMAGTFGTTLVVNLPGSPRGAIEGLDAVLPLVEHVCDLVHGDTRHESD